LWTVKVNATNTDTQNHAQGNAHRPQTAPHERDGNIKRHGYKEEMAGRREAKRAAAAAAAAAREKSKSPERAGGGVLGVVQQNFLPVR